MSTNTEGRETGETVRVGGGGGVGWCFFFQAEDGIRDDLVTGVQTCALPIYMSYSYVAQRAIRRISAGLGNLIPGFNKS